MLSSLLYPHPYVSPTHPTPPHPTPLFLPRCSSKLTAYLLELSDDFRAVFLPSCSSSLAVRYGVILVLVFHGPASVVELFCPHMQALVRDISSLAESGTAEVKQGVDKVMEAILVSTKARAVVVKKIFYFSWWIFSSAI